jgi:ParB-like chromosome segregation protein Spo0J
MDNFPAYKTISTADLIPYARNSRTHSDVQVAKLAASIKEFGFLNPIITDGENGIVAGHGRVMAAQKLGLEALPCIEAGHLTDAQKRAYIIADNRMALDAGWDNDLLKIELQDLDADGFDLTLTGFDLDEMAALFDELVDDNNQEKEQNLEEHENQLLLQFESEVQLEEWFSKFEQMDGVTCKIL